MTKSKFLDLEAKEGVASKLGKVRGGVHSCSALAPDKPDYSGLSLHPQGVLTRPPEYSFKVPQRILKFSQSFRADGFGAWNYKILIS